MHVSLGGFTFHGDDYRGSSGFTIAGQSGWTGGAGSKRAGVSREGGHGAFRVPSHRPDRVFTFQGRYWGTSPADVQHKGDALSGLEGLSLPVTVAWHETRWALVEVDRVRYEPSGYGNYADYQIDLWMPDPFKYGETVETVSSGSNVTVFHRGNTAAVPRFRVTGPFSGGYRLRGPAGESFSVITGLASGAVDEIDFRSPIVRRNGSPLTRAVLSPETWSVPGGASVQWRVEAISGGGGNGRCFLTDTYI